MEPINFKGQTTVLGAPANWDSAAHGECVGLPVMRDADGFMRSCWRMTFRERLKLIFGAPLTLVVASVAHPPVKLEVGTP